MLNNDIVESEIDLIVEVKKSIRLLLKYKYYVLSISLLMGILGFYYAKISKPIYKSDLSFSIKSEMGGTFASISNLSSLLGGGTNPSGSPLERTIEVVKSEALILKVLFSSIKINNKEDLFINHFIDIYDYRTKWESSSDTSLNQLRSVQYEVYNSLNNLTFLQKKHLRLF